MRRALCGVIAASMLLAGLASPVAAGGGTGITNCEGAQTGAGCPGNPTTTTGVYFTVTAGGGNRGFASVAVSCSASSGAVIYATVLTITVLPKETGTSATIYPPASTCTADLVKLNQIGSARVLASTSFTVTQG